MEQMKVWTSTVRWAGPCVLTALLIISACGGSRADGNEPEPPSSVAQLDALGREDPTLVACSIVSLPAVVYGVPGTSVARRGRAGMGPSRLSQSILRDIAVQDAMAEGARRGMSASEAEEVATRVQREREANQRLEPVAPARPLDPDEPLLPAYASLWASLLTEPDSTEVITSRIEEIEVMDPAISEEYAAALLYIAREWSLGCEEPAP